MTRFSLIWFNKLLNYEYPMSHRQPNSVKWTTYDRFSKFRWSLIKIRSGIKKSHLRTAPRSSSSLLPTPKVLSKYRLWARWAMHNSRQSSTWARVPHLRTCSACFLAVAISGWPYDCCRVVMNIIKSDKIHKYFSTNKIKTKGIKDPQKARKDVQDVDPDLSFDNQIFGEERCDPSGSEGKSNSEVFHFFWIIHDFVFGIQIIRPTAGINLLWNKMTRLA